MRLRAHHLICLFGFRGMGYSEDFVNNFKKVFNRIKDNPELKIEVVNQADDICSACPHQKNSSCQKNGPESEKNICNKDNLIIRRLGIRMSEKYPASEILKRVVKNIHSQELNEICQGCEWLKYGYCVDGLKKT